jgi:hypothetical protein
MFRCRSRFLSPSHLGRTTTSTTSWVSHHADRGHDNECTLQLLLQMNCAVAYLQFLSLVCIVISSDSIFGLLLCIQKLDLTLTMGTRNMKHGVMAHKNK